LRLEDKHAVATWLSKDAWGQVRIGLEAVEFMNVRRESARRVLAETDGSQFNPNEYRSTAGAAFRNVEAALTALTRASNALAEPSGSADS
jgi:hypothetical protein